jgi:hypothetical protein
VASETPTTSTAANGTLQALPWRRVTHRDLRVRSYPTPDTLEIAVADAPNEHANDLTVPTKCFAQAS